MTETLKLAAITASISAVPYCNLMYCVLCLDYGDYTLFSFQGLMEWLGPAPGVTRQRLFLASEIGTRLD